MGEISLERTTQEMDEMEEGKKTKKEEETQWKIVVKERIERRGAD